MMRSDDEAGKVRWCMKQRRGIKLEEPNDNLCEVYIKKAKSSLNMLDAAIERGEIEWIVTTAYYARYFAVYALFQKCGIKSEIHDCTLSAVKYLLVDEGVLDAMMYKDILDAKHARVDVQYYAIGAVNNEKLIEKAKGAQEFVLSVEGAMEKVDDETKQRIREKLGQN